ncbi:MAG: tRNA (N6-isopentenyl adenosine(37)-C2)-methylthiotransferase MiaB [Clostridiales bacterium]|jgi:tRNA-2-methylthio-N6-dimethylallyladenosine synthase|nr:tRNA (N6-isopentenyl adenosine(37)-C2)-methylthiotransferase MiaB [Clostridiales bacterium]
MKTKTARVITYGCQQNENDSERIRGILLEAGYTLTDHGDDGDGGADLIIFNTCAVRDNAEQRVYGNLGALRRVKEQRPEMLIGVCGCMAQQTHVAEHIKKRFPYVDFVFGTYALARLPQILYSVRSQRVFDIERSGDGLAEHLPRHRQNGVTATVSVMYGCNNFCSYCVVPYVRGRERSRAPKDIIREVEGLAAQGCREVTLLGQNVNSYAELPFGELLELVSGVEGIERVRFVSSHPKDVTPELIDVMARNRKVCKQLHLPFQAGSDKVLADMNRKYTKERYLELVAGVKEKIPGIALSGDVIVGFPTETDEDFDHTIDVIRQTAFDMLFTFIYSKREGTPAAKMPPVLPPERVKVNFDRLIAEQNAVSLKKNTALVGTTQQVLVEGVGKSGGDSMLTGRTDGAKIVNFAGNQTMIGKMIGVKITRAATWSLTGEVAANK